MVGLYHYKRVIFSRKGHVVYQQSMKVSSPSLLDSCIQWQYILTAVSSLAMQCDHTGSWPLCVLSSLAGRASQISKAHFWIFLKQPRRVPKNGCMSGYRNVTTLDRLMCKVCGKSAIYTTHSQHLTELKLESRLPVLQCSNECHSHLKRKGGTCRLIIGRQDI